MCRLEKSEKFGILEHTLSHYGEHHTHKYKYKNLNWKIKLMNPKYKQPSRLLGNQIPLNGAADNSINVKTLLIFQLKTESQCT